MDELLFGTARDPAPTTVTLVVAVAGFTVVGLMWMAAAFGRGGIGLARLRDQNELGGTGGTGGTGEPGDADIDAS